MKPTIFFVLALLWSVSTGAQLQDIFEDGDFTSNPAWGGTTDDFSVIDQILQLDAAAAGTAYLSTPVIIDGSTTWTFLIELDFNPSASGNFPKIYLSANNADLSGAINGYFLRIGESNANDAFELYRQDGTDEVFLYRFTTEGEMGASSNNKARIHISRSDVGVWQFSADHSGSYCFTDEGTVVDNQYPTGSHFGFFCKYTVSNIDNFFFDDVYVDLTDPNADNELSLEMVTAADPVDVLLHFSTLLNPVSAETASNYTIQNSGGSNLGNPTAATLDGTDNSLVHLDISNLPLTSGESYTVVVSGLTDCSGNLIGPNNSITFTLFIPEMADPFDIIINEIMADPTPVVSSLPEAEFVELYNRSNKTFNLDGFKFSDSGTPKILDFFILQPNSYVVLCDTDDEALFAPFGNVLGVDNFPGLDNGGDQLRLYDADDNVIDEVVYDDDWYQDSDRDDGGWTLELINPDLYCQGAVNWQASDNPDGGTPGGQNENFDDSPDDTPPLLLDAIPLSNQQVRLFFNETMGDVVPDFIQIAPATAPIVSTLLEPPGNTLLVDVGTPFFQHQTTYTLTLSGNVTDCVGNPISTDFNSIQFSYYDTEAAEPLDILINEIMAKPSETVGALPDEEFVELYNRSDKYINLEGFQFSDAGSPKTLGYHVLLPDSFVILCHVNDVALFTPFGNVVGVPSFPGLNDDMEDLFLADPNGAVIDQVSYTDKWYRNKNKDGGGWTLELINPELVCQKGFNWRAAEAVAGGTPGAINSIRSDEPDLRGPKLLGADAINDHQIRLTFDEPLAASPQPGFFQLSGPTGTVASSLLETSDRHVLLSTTAPFFQENATYVISVQPQLTDCSGNAVSTEFNSLEFLYFEPEEAEPYDLLINEIFADPSPSIGLPGAEYLELYNRSDKNISLEGFSLVDRNDVYPLPFFLLQPGAYVILHQEGCGSFGIYGDTLSLCEFASLGNTTDSLSLVDPFGDVIDAVHYLDDWYQDPGKVDGGWSLELINPNNYCDPSNNWRASANPVGGTPGAINSVYDDGPDESALDLICAYPVSASRISLFFNKAIDRNLDVSQIEMAGFDIVSVWPVPPVFQTALVDISPVMEPGQRYVIGLEGTVADCRGNEVGMFDEAEIALPDEFEPLDLVINEVLFNPQTGGSDFVELYNRSDKVLDIARLNIASREGDDRDSIHQAVAVRTSCLLFPEDYVVLTKNPHDIRNRYEVFDVYAFSKTALPTYEDKEGTVVVYEPLVDVALVVDEFRYEESMQHPLLDSKDGVSLERIDPDGVTQSDDNWHSAAADAGFATPTYLNSQFIDTPQEEDDLLWLENDRLSPDQDGFEDFLQINYALDRPGYTANIRIYDAKGRPVKSLTDNELLMAEGFFKWDGVDDEGGRARTGIHILEAALHHPDGDVRNYKLAFVVASRLD